MKILKRFFFTGDGFLEGFGRFRSRSKISENVGNGLSPELIEIILGAFAAAALAFTAEKE
jgi:hypothetical protein